MRLVPCPGYGSLVFLLLCLHVFLGLTEHVGFHLMLLLTAPLLLLCIHQL